MQTRCIVKGEAQKNPLFWRFSGGCWFSQDRLFSRNSTRRPLNLIKSPIFTNTPCKSTYLSLQCAEYALCWVGGVKRPKKYSRKLCRNAKPEKDPKSLGTAAARPFLAATTFRTHDLTHSRVQNFSNFALVKEICDDIFKMISFLQPQGSLRPQNPMSSKKRNCKKKCKRPKIGRTPRGRTLQGGIPGTFWKPPSQNPFWEPFSEPLLRTLKPRVDRLLKTLPQNPFQNLLRTLLRTLCCRTTP